MDTQLKRSVEKLGRVELRATEMVRGLENESPGVRWRDLHLFNLVKEKPRGNLITAYNCSEGSYKRERESLIRDRCYNKE